MECLKNNLAAKVDHFFLLLQEINLLLDTNAFFKKLFYTFRHCQSAFSGLWLHTPRCAKPTITQTNHTYQTEYG
jgi:hypothetical protein